MLLIDGVSNDASFNLASEEYLLDNFTESIFYLWQNSDAVIVGKNQNTLSEIDRDFVEKNGIKVVRRLTGGGAVFHDMGNLNYSVIGNGTEGFGDYSAFCETVIGCLGELGVAASLSGRNDLIAGGRKISGNAQCLRHGRLLHHGTLLWSADMARLSGALRVKPEKYKNRGIASVSSRVVNISELIPDAGNVETFRAALRSRALRTLPDIKQYTFSDKDISSIEKLSCEKYSTWEWNYGEAPSYGFENGARTAAGVVEVRLSVEDGLIAAISLTGDFFGKKEVSGLEKALIGVRHEKAALTAALRDAGCGDYLSGAAPDELAELFF